MVLAVYELKCLEILTSCHELSILRVWITLVAHLVEERDVSVLELCIPVCEIRRKDVSYAKTMTADLVCVSRADTLES